MRKSIWALLWTVWAFVWIACGQTTAAASLDQAIEQGRAMVEDYRQAREIPGLTLAVSIKGRIVWSQGFGWADLEQRTPVGRWTKMRIGSVSKSLTSVAVGLLHQAGKLDLDAPVQRYVPSFPQKEHPVTTRLAAGHLAGIRHYRGTEFLSSKSYRTVSEGLKIFQDDPLLSQPGTAYSYSSYGWNLVSAVVEGAAQQPFLDFMHHEVFLPLGMRDTVADHPERIIENRTRFYLRTPQGIRNAPYVDNSYKWAGGGYLSTAEDLVRFANGLLEGRLLAAETRELLWTSLRTADGEETNYGIGWGLATAPDGQRTVGHGGGSMGGSSRLLVFLEDRIVLAWIVNVSGPTRAPRFDLTGEVAKLFLGLEE